jgi:hypothetical protein
MPATAAHAHERSKGVGVAAAALTMEICCCRRSTSAGFPAAAQAGRATSVTRQTQGWRRKFLQYVDGRTSIILLDMRRETPSSVGTGCHRSAGFPTQEQDQGPFAFSEKKGMKARAQINGEQHFAITGSLPNSRKSNLGSWTFVAVLVHGVGGKKPKISPLSKTLSCYLFLAVVVVIRATGGGGSDVEAAVAVAAAMVRKRKLPRWRSDTLL